MHISDTSGPCGRSRRALALPLLAYALLTLVGCAPAERVADPLDWPREWGGRSLWSTPHAYIYAASGPSAGEIDRVVARAQREYAAELGQPTPPVLVIVCDAGEAYPASDVRALLRAALRVTLRRDVPPPSEGESQEATGTPTPKEIDEALDQLLAVAYVTGTSLDVLVGTIPLACDTQALRETCQAPAGPSNQADGALVLPTRACLRSSVRRMMRGTLRLYGIGPAAQVLFAPVLALAEARSVDQLDRLRDVALFNHWLFEHADFPVAQKQEIAEAWCERLAESSETAAASIVGLAK